MYETKIRNITLQTGRPKVVVPLVSVKPADIIAECEQLKDLPCDMVEWRADYYLSAIEDLDGHLVDKNGYLDIVKILDDINFIADEEPLIFTLRSKAQGGKIEVNREQLESIYGLAAESKLVDAIDIELFDGNGEVHEEWIREQIDEAHRHGVKVVLSHHDNDKMLSPAELVAVVKKMYTLGADICKVAAMAHTKEEAEGLLKATAYLTKNKIGPIVMLAMGEAGKVTRVAAGKYGSCMTFASAKEPSAPGQADVFTMKKWLDKYYEGEVR